MTSQVNKIKKEIVKKSAPLLCLILTVMMLILAEEVKDAIVAGMKLAALRIIPTLFPFMILSDYWLCNVDINKNSRLGLLFEKSFKLSSVSLKAFLTGIFAGFPLGVKTGTDLYECGSISSDELQRLAPIINLPSLAFVISGVGLGLYRDIKIGVLLYISVLASSVMVGSVEAKNKKILAKQAVISGQTFNLTTSIKQAGLSSLTVSSYIIFFSGIIGLISALFKNPLLSVILSAFLEVGNAASMISKHSFPSTDFSLLLTAFALGFSGFSVHLQAFSFLPEEISKTKYLLTKLIIGLLSSTIMLLFLPFVNI